MYSTDHNLNDPTSVDLIDLLRNIQLRVASIEHVTQLFYDRLQKKDPMTIYVITDDPHGKIYFGDIPIKNSTPSMKYLIGQDRPDEWIIYMNEYIGVNEPNRLTPICRFDDPQKAIDTLAIYNRVGSHSTMNIEIYNIMKQYIDEDTSICGFILGLLNIFGYREDPRLQNVIQIMTATGCEIGQVIDNGKSYFQHDLSIEFQRYLQQYTDVSSNSIDLMKLVCSIYNSMILHGILKKKHDEDDSMTNLSEVIDDIVKCYVTFGIGGLNV